MKLHNQVSPSHFLMTSYGSGFARVNDQTYHESLIIRPTEDPIPWAVQQFSDLTEDVLHQIPHDGIEILLLGTGAQQHFIHPKLITHFHAQRIAVECMSSEAAARTYNILASEERKVVLAYILT